MKKKLQLLHLLILLCGGVNTALAQLTFNNSLNAQQLAQILSGPGITVTNAAFTCPTNGIGSFSGGLTTNIGIGTGIILTTGPNSIASGPNNDAQAGTCAFGTFPGNPGSGDPDLQPLAGAQTYDACKLEFDMLPLCDTLKFKYVFASEEYPEFTCSTYNDAFAFFLSGPGITGQQNLALIPNTSIPVAINSVNNGSVGTNGTSGGCTSLNYSQYYVDNTGGTTIQYDGFTTVMVAKSYVQPCQTYHLKISIADAGDCIFDSGLLLQAGSLICQPVKSITDIQNAVEGCQNGMFKFCRDDSTNALTFNYTIAGTATNGTDYTTIANSITIPAGQGCFTLPIIPTADGLAEPTETLMLIYQPGACPGLDTATITIIGSPPINAGPDTTICSGSIISIGITPPVTGTTYSWTPTTGLSSTSSSYPTVTLTNTGTSPASTMYILTATNLQGCVSKDTVNVTVNPMPTVYAGNDQTLCSSSFVQLSGTIGGSATSGTWSNGVGTYFPYNTNLNTTYTPDATEADGGYVILILTTNDPAGACPAAFDSLVIYFNGGAVVSAWADQIICAGSTVTLAGVVTGTSNSGQWSGGSGTFSPDDTTLNAVYTPSAAEAATADSVTLTLTSFAPPGSCPDVSDQMKIFIYHSPTANAGSAQHICSGSDITLSGSIGGSATVGTWSGGTGNYLPDNTTLNAVYTPSPAEYTAGSVTLTLTTDDPLGPCTFSSSMVTFDFYPSPVVDFTVDSAAGCAVHCTNFTNLTTIAPPDTIASWN